MSGISTGIGLVSGINSSALIEQLLAIESRGRAPIQARIGTLQAGKTALMDVNARLLSLRNSASKFRLGKVFSAVTARSSSEAALVARAEQSTPPGSYQFTVGRLASTSQFLTRGYATRDATPLGLDRLDFAWGDAGLARDVALADLRGGAGVRRGRIEVRDAMGRAETIDLSTAVTIDDVVARLNAASSVEVDAAIEDERLVVRDRSGGTGALVVSDLAGGSTALDFGIRGTFSSGVASGASLGGLAMTSSLAGLNDGGGVFIRDGVVDFRLRVAGTTYDVSLGRENLPISTDTKLGDLRNGQGIRINATDADDFTVTTSTGVSVGVNLGAVVVDGETQSPAVRTVGEMVARVNAELAGALGPGAVVMSIREDGKGFRLVDTLGGDAPLRVLGAGPNSESTARDLGLFTGASSTGGATLVGSIVVNKVQTPRAASIEDLAARVAAQTGGAVSVGINAAGTGLALTSTGGGSIEVLPGSGDGSSLAAAVAERTARDLGIFGLSGDGSVEGSRLSAAVGSVRLATLRGGSGFGSAGPVTIVDRSGTGFTFDGLAAHDTLASLVSAINAQASTAGVDVRLSVGPGGRALVARDSSGGSGTLAISGSGASALGLERSAGADAIQGDDLGRRILTLGTRLSSLGFGRGAGTGVIRITDATGATASVDVDARATTVYDVIAEINSRGLAIEARLNDAGDGISIVDLSTGTPTSRIEVTDVSGVVAKSLGIAGRAAATGEDLRGSLVRGVDLETTDTLADVVRKINAAGLDVNAAIINAGSGATPFRLSLTSRQGGSLGRLSVGAGAADLGLVETVAARDASLFLGAGAAGEGFLYVSSTNVFRDVVAGLEVEAKSAGSTSTVDVARDVEGIVENVRQFTAAVTDALARIREYDRYDDTTKRKGPLLGDPTVARLRQQIVQAAQGSAVGVEGRYRTLSQVGIRFGKDGALLLDEAKFRAAYEADPAAVEELFSAYEVEISSTSPTTGSGASPATTYAKLGFGDLYDQLLKKLTNSVDGVVSIADRGFEAQMEGLRERLSRYDARLEVRRLRYQAQFAALEANMARLQSQQSSLSAMASSISLMR